MRWQECRRVWSELKEGGMKIGDPKEENKCLRCGGLGTIPTPDRKHNEICPVCGGSGKIIKWDKGVNWYWS